MTPETLLRFKKLLLQTGTLTEATLAPLETLPGPQLVTTLLCEKHCSRDRILEILAEVFRVPAIDLLKTPPQREVLDLASTDFCLRQQALPVRIEDGHVCIAVADPENLLLIDEMQAAIGRPVRAFVSLPNEIESFLKNAPESTQTAEIVAEILKKEEDGEVPVRLSTKSEAVKPVVQLLDRILHDAVARQALHLYIIPFGEEEDVRVRLGLKSKIVETHRYPARLHPKVVNRLRVLSDLLGKDKRAPQNGAFLTLVDGEKHRLDVMIVPSPNGEAVTIFVDQEVDLGDKNSEAFPPHCGKCRAELKKAWYYCPMCGTKI